ncbi:MinD/ParA family ATP-binding protein [Cumulibacter manganitolerans]|uniref:MinD/ParA family ATP-binding protein n=1 Tax=Cumulibacter manganitolerans TaxID=1884992 RepID=UPI0012973161|nr:MinD/ParA family protein [Cumulibacter manganitolerans]
MIEVQARIFDPTSASIDGYTVTLRPEDPTVYSAILRHARTRAREEQQRIQLIAHDLTRGQHDTLHIDPDGTIQQHPAAAAAPAAAASPPPAPGAPPPAQTHSPVSVPPLHDFVRPVTPAPARGWRKLVHTLTRGTINPGPSPDEQRHRDLLDAVRTRATRAEVIATICLKGGIGKTSTTAGVGLTLARHRGDRIIALDANPDAGDLYERTCPGTPPATLTDLAARAGDVASMTDLARYAGIADRLSVIAGDQEPTISESLSADDFVTALRAVQHYYNVVMVDCGTGVTHPSMVGILSNARHVIIAGGYAVSGARRAESTLRWLAANGYQHLARTAVVVLTQTTAVSNIVDTAAIENTLAQLSATVIRVPHDQAVADGTTISLDRLQSATTDSYLQIAASIARNFQ